jgi:DNA repair protein RadC
MPPRSYPPLFAGQVQEMLAVAHLDAGWRLIETRRMPTDAEADCIALPLRDIVADTIRLGSAALVIAHNHPSGDPQPSRTDLDATRALSDVLRPIGIRLYDHMIFGGAKWRSLRMMGLL